LNVLGCCCWYVHLRIRKPSHYIWMDEWTGCKLHIGYHCTNGAKPMSWGFLMYNQCSCCNSYPVLYRYYYYYWDWHYTYSYNADYRCYCNKDYWYN
jgi:hypothetical protein